MFRKLLAALFLLFTICQPASAQTRHMYVNGIMQRVSEGALTIGGEVFVLDPRVKVFVQTYSNGAFHEVPGRFHDIVTGVSASVKVTGKVVSEIIIERWKR